MKTVLGGTSKNKRAKTKFGAGIQHGLKTTTTKYNPHPQTTEYAQRCRLNSKKERTQGTAEIKECSLENEESYVVGYTQK